MNRANAKLGCALAMVLGSALLVAFSHSDASEAEIVRSVAGNKLKRAMRSLRREWLPDPFGPAYTNASCKLIEFTRDCLTNGRPDTGYLYWRWKPFGCELPKFDAGKFLDLMRNKAWAFIGDSLLQNQRGSLLCLLSKVEEAVEIYREAFTICHIPENNAIVGCHNCAAAGQNATEYGGDFSYRKALRLAFSFMLSSDHKPLVLFRTWNTEHYEFGGDGMLVCNRTVPYRAGEYDGRPTDHLMRGVEVEEFRRAAARSGARIRLVDTFRLSVLRPDAHMGLYWLVDRDPGDKTMNDCTHWCLPGAIDTWNDIAMEILMREGEFRYSS
uniref:Uncharacterized protein n=1 Tax=Ananas comosus var. bracteatus TaxID=296719 RepID=A0A6V7PTE5_ANACO|nr:unnamed protein product [Ananas comosus var. bracteatus]